MVKALFYLWLSTSLLLGGCRQAAPSRTGVVASMTATQNTPVTVQEQPVQVIPLAGPAAKTKAEFSGLDWFGDTLILLPQYPQRFGSGKDGALFAIPKADILSYLDGKSQSPLQPEEIPFSASGISKEIKGFEGYEAIAVDGEQVYLTIEAKPSSMLGYLVRGTIAPDLSEILLDGSQLTEIPPQAALENMGDEALLIYDQHLYSFYEANGSAVNPSPVSHVFDQSLHPVETIPFPNIEYRITDASRADDQGRFWAINYLFFVDIWNLKAGEDPLVARFGEGPTHALYQTVERLLPFQITSDGIFLQDVPPIQLQLINDVNSRNWEGIAELDGRGFLLVTDTYPETILGFVPNP